jgi:hypothetical protein
LPVALTSAAKIMGVLGLAGLVGLLALPRLEGLINQLWRRLPVPETWRTRLADMVSQFLLGMRALQHPGRALSFAGLTAIIWLVDALGSTITAHALGLALTLPQALLLLAALGLASATPSTPGYVGIYQFVAVTVLGPFGFTQSEALAFIVVAQAMIYIVVAVWGLLGLGRLSLGAAGGRVAP